LNLPFLAVALLQQLELASLGLRTPLDPCKIPIVASPISQSVRIDKWLWATRFFKTRSLAADACATGKLKRNGHPLKPASTVQVGDLLEIPFVEGPGVREVAVVALIEKRVGAPEAQACYQDRTAPEVYESLKLWQIAKQEAAKGRPTKRDRREIDKIHGFWDPV
jgi:ribosome-associated heat shock protein Hsp15